MCNYFRVFFYHKSLYKRVTFRGNWVTLTVSTILIRKDERSYRKLSHICIFQLENDSPDHLQDNPHAQMQHNSIHQSIVPKVLKSPHCLVCNAKLGVSARGAMEVFSDRVSIYCYFDYNFFYCSWFSYLLTLSLLSISCMGHCNVLPFFYKVTSHFLL